MSDKNQEQETIESVTDNHTDVDTSKRKFSKAGMVAPVIMTLASKPVFAVQGLSNMMSGNASIECGGNTRFGGFSPGYWKQLQHISEWIAAGVSYGALSTNCVKNPSNDKQECPGDNSFGKAWWHYVDGGSVPGIGSGKPLREILNEDEGSDDFHYAAAYLNIKYFGANYIFNLAQFDTMLANPYGAPWFDSTSPGYTGYDSLKDLIQKNYHYGIDPYDHDENNVPNMNCKGVGGLG